MPTSATAELAAAEQRRAVLAGLGCYILWGLVPLVFQLMGRLGVGAFEIMAHRIVWGFVAVLILIGVSHQRRELMAVLRTPRTVAWLALSAALIATNWTIFVWSVNNGRTLETSLGYYISPLVSMAAGAFIFRERIGRIGQVAIALAVVGVIIQAVALGHLPYISVGLALTFGSYGIVRKRVAADASVGLFVECLILFLPALAYITWLEHAGGGNFLASVPATAWLVASGPITAAPLVLFSWAARRMPLSTMGFLQFLAPTMTFVIGVTEGEAFSPLRGASFAFIWIGAAVFLYGMWRKARGLRMAPPRRAVGQEGG
jgi:chloramphenicol-sensitive protein RarD